LKTSDFYFDLPKELIAQDPLEKRDSSRLLKMDRNTGEVEHRYFSDITDYFREGDLLVLNNTKVIPARLLGTKEETGANVEVFLLKRISDDTWETLVKPGKKLKPGTFVSFGQGLLRAEILETLDDGGRIVKFYFDGIFEEILDRLGEMPLPPYITHKLKNKDRYQTVYAKYEVSVAAPTAGLHFTNELLEKVKEMGVDIAYVTLHVGLGTFRPVKVDDVTNHVMHSESYFISKEAADKINNTKKAGGRVICVGTTSVRTLESAALDDGSVNESQGDTSIFIYPGYKFKVLDGLITNFHLPESTLVMLVSAFSSKEKVLNAYDIAVKEKYRFFSFGDAMMII